MGNTSLLQNNYTVVRHGIDSQHHHDSRHSNGGNTNVDELPEFSKMFNKNIETAQFSPLCPIPEDSGCNQVMPIDHDYHGNEYTEQPPVIEKHTSRPKILTKRQRSVRIDQRQYRVHENQGGHISNSSRPIVHNSTYHTYCYGTSHCNVPQGCENCAFSIPLSRHKDHLVGIPVNTKQCISSNMNADYFRNEQQARTHISHRTDNQTENACQLKTDWTISLPLDNDSRSIRSHVMKSSSSKSGDSVDCLSHIPLAKNYLTLPPTPGAQKFSTNGANNISRRSPRSSDGSLHFAASEAGRSSLTSESRRQSIFDMVPSTISAQMVSDNPSSIAEVAFASLEIQKKTPAWNTVNLYWRKCVVILICFISIFIVVGIISAVYLNARYTGKMF